MDYACKVSVIIPVYNMAQYLDQTIASWTAQTLKDIEIICIDDGSSDDSLRILEEKARADNRILVCAFPANKGTWAARNFGIEKAGGQYILFADADDTALPETCEELALTMDKCQTDILQYSAEVLDPNGQPEPNFAGLERYLTPYDGLLYGKDAFLLCFRDRKYAWNLCGKVFKTEICKNILSQIVAIGIQEEHVQIAEDVLLYFMLSYTAQSYKGIRGKKYYQYYRGRGGSGRKIIQWHYFNELCTQPNVSSMMNMFLKRQSALNTYKAIIQNIRDGFLTNTIRAWRDLKDADKASGLELMIQRWTMEEVIGKLTKLYFINDSGNKDKEISRLKQELDCRNQEIWQLRHGNYIKRVARAVIPNRIKPYIKAMVRSIPQGIKAPVKRLLRW